MDSPSKEEFLRRKILILSPKFFMEMTEAVADLKPQQCGLGRDLGFKVLDLRMAFKPFSCDTEELSI